MMTRVNISITKISKKNLAVASRSTQLFLGSDIRQSISGGLRENDAEPDLTF
jgi:hypothetical protein